MKKILLYPAGVAQKEAFIEAKSMGLYIITIDKNRYAECFSLADESYQVDPGNIQEVKEFLRQYDKKIDGALLVGADIPETQVYITKKLGTDGVSAASARLTVDKYAMKTVMQNAGVNVPDFYKVTNHKEIEEIFSKYHSRMVLKPNDNCGARGVLQITNNTDFEKSFIHSSSYTKKKYLLLEKFEEGLQISIEGIVIDKSLHITGVADRNYDKLETHSPYIIENGATMPTLLSKMEKKAVTEMFAKAVKSLQIETGVVKGDIIFNGKEAFVVEVASRISGGKFASKLVPLSTGVNLLHIALRQAMNMKICKELFTPKKEEGVAVRYFFPKPGKLQKIAGLSDVQEKKAFEELVITYSSGDMIGPITSHPERGGWVVCHAENRQKAIDNAELIINKINFVV